MQKKYTKMLYIIFGIIGCTIILVFGIFGRPVISENNVTMATFVYQDKEKYNSLLKLRRYISTEEILETYVEVQIKKEHWNDLIKIVNASRLSIGRNIPFGPKYDIREPDYVIRIYYANNKRDYMLFWDGNYHFTLRGWRIIKDKDRKKIYEILSYIKNDSMGI